MKVIFFGTPDFAVSTLEKLISAPEFEVLAVVTQPDKRRGRGNQLIPSAVKKVAIAHNLPVFQPEKIKKDAGTIEQLQKYAADVFVVVAYGQILSQKILDIPRLGCINVHGSILPEYRGAAPIQWCLYRGEKTTGITTMLMDKGMDTGAMLLKAYTAIDILDNAESLAEKLAIQGADLLIETLSKIDQIKPEPQEHNQATYAPMITKDNYIIDWQRSPLEIHNQIRAFYPYCVSNLRDHPVKILSSYPLTDEYLSSLPNSLQKLENYREELFTIIGETGTIVKIIKGIGIVVKTGEGLLLLTEVQPAGKKPQKATDFANGMRLNLGEKWSYT